MKKITTTIQKLEEYIIVFSFAAMVLASFSQVVNRNFIGAGVSWFEELSRYAMVYMALLATELGLRDGTQVSVTAFTDACSPAVRFVLSVISKLVVIGFAGIVCFTSFQLLEKQIMFDARSAGLNIPMFIPYFALPLSFALIVIVQSARLYNMIVEALEARRQVGKGTDA